MAGIYIHIPFCKQACHYCDFHFSTSQSNKEALIGAICKEIEIRADYLQKKEISTIYFGGGTPSLLNRTETEKILNTIHKQFTITRDAEITLEANPDDLSTAKTSELRSLGINRLSIGIQSFLDEHLVLMNRSHTSLQAINAVDQARKSGINNISIDLIYGLPGLNPAGWKNNLKQAFLLDVPHISAYCLTVEKKTALNHMMQNNTITLPEEPIVLEQFQILMEEAGKHDFIHYEISNFCKENMYSRHNSNYWKSEPYLGIGPSAHSYNGISRQWNIANNALYVKGINAPEAVFEKEELSVENRFNEYVMTRLRTIWGIDLKFVETTFGEKISDQLQAGLKEFMDADYVQQNKENVILTKKGKFLADKIASDLFI